MDIHLPHHKQTAPAQPTPRDRSLTRNNKPLSDDRESSDSRPPSIDRNVANRSQPSNSTQNKTLPHKTLKSLELSLGGKKKKLQFKDDFQVKPSTNNKQQEKINNVPQSALKSKTSINTVQTCKSFQYSTTFDKVRQCFQKFIRTKYPPPLYRKLKLVNSSKEQATARKGSFGSCGCIMSLFMSEEPAVYQVKVCSGNKTRAKVLLVQGAEEDFFQFSRQFLISLWKDNILKISQSQHVQYFVLSHQRVTKVMLAECKHITLQVKEDMGTTRSDGLVKTFKRQLHKLKKIMAGCPQVTPGSYSQRKLQDMIYSQIKLFELYDAIYKTQHHAFLKKKHKIKNKLCTETIFQHLQIAQHFTLFSQLISKRPSELTEIKERPYETCIRWMEEMRESDAPASILQKISIFNQRVKQNYLDYHVQRVRISDMDDFLPITIYCVLEMESNVNLLAIVKLLLVYLSEEEEYECEKKLLATMEAAIDYILNEWMLDVSIEDHFRKESIL